MSSSSAPASRPPSAPVLGAVARDAAELAGAVRREFERALLERFGQPPAQDPTLAALFHASAVQLARVYAEAEQLFPEAVLDDLVAGLAMPARAAQPAQTVVGFTGVTAGELVTPDTPLAGVTPRGERLAFALDVPVRVSAARLVFAGVVEGGRLHVVPGATLPDDPGLPGAPPLPLPSAVAPLAAGDGDAPPALLLAFDADAGTHLGGLGLFVDMQQADHPAARALGRSTWTLVRNGGPAADGPEVADDALRLRARPGPGGVRILDWADAAVPGADPHGAGRRPDPVDGAADAPPGVYGPLCWCWPEVPAERRVRSAPPPQVAAVLDQVVPVDFVARYVRPLVWVRAVLPAGTRGVAAAVQRVVAHAAPASNVEPFHERVDLDALGAVVAFRPEGARGRHLVRVLGITGEHGTRYVDEADAAAGPARGRYRVRGGELELRPARTPAGGDRCVFARLLYTDGARGNALQPGDVTLVGPRDARGVPAYAAASLAVTRGGGGPPSYAPARARLAERLRTRERVVTSADVHAAARAFDPRVLGASVRADVAPGGGGAPPRAVQVVAATVRRADVPDAEAAAFAAGLERHLAARAPLGAALRVELRRIDRERRPAPRAGGDA